MMTTEQRNELMEKRQETAGSKGKSIWHFAYSTPKDAPIWKAKEGINIIDIIPYQITNEDNKACEIGLPVGELDYMQIYGVHKGIGPDKKKEFLCEKKTFGDDHRCVLCEIGAEDKASGGDGLYVNTYAVYNIIDTDDREKGIQIWKTPYNWSERMFKANAGAYKQRGLACNYTDHENGVSLQIIGEGQVWKKNKFVKPTSCSFVPRAKQYTLEDCLKAYPIDSYYVREEQSVLEAEYNGLEVNESEKSTPQAPPASKTTPALQKTETEQLQENAVVETKVEANKQKPRIRERIVTEPACKLCSMGLKFGVDFQSDDNKCNNCDEDEWNKCADENERLKKTV